MGSRSSVLTLLLATSALVGPVPHAFAQNQTEDAKAPADSDIVVTGQVLAEKRAVEIKRRSGLVSDNLSSDETGSLPDYGLGQALKRLPGINMVINNGRGEEQYMIIRGLAPGYNTTTLDGIQLPSTELGSTGAATSTASGRTVSYDVLPSSLAKAVNVFKSWQVDLPSDAIGGVTNIVTRSAFDSERPFLDVGAKWAYWEDRRQWHSNSPSGEGDIAMGTRFGADKQFGAVFAASYYRRVSHSWDTVSNGTQAFYPYTGGTQTLSAVTVAPSTDLSSLTNVPGQFGWLSYEDIRTRQSFYGKLEYRGDATQVTLSAGLAQHFLDEQRNNQYLTTSGQATLTSANTGSYAAGGASAGNDFYRIKRQLAFTQAEVHHDLGEGSHLDLTLNYAHGIYNQQSVDDSFTYNGTGASLAQNFTTFTNARDLSVPVNNTAVFLNPASYNLAYHQFADNHGESKAPTVKFDLGWHDGDADHGLGLRTGLVWRDLHQSGWTQQNRLDAPKGVTMASLGGSFMLTPYDGLGQQVLTASPYATAAYYAANAANFTSDASNLSASSIGTYSLEENILAGYAMALFHGDAVSGSAGVRIETTEQSIQNYLPSSFVSSSKATSFSPNFYGTSYTKVLPALNLAWDARRDLKIRFGASETLARPDYSQLAQNSSVTVTTPATTTVNGIASQSISNPFLKPRLSKNFDLSLEFYPGHGSVLAVGGFDKEISNEIVTLNNIQSGVAVNGAPGLYTITTTQAQNVGKASARGIELNAVLPHFWFLPGMLSWFGFSGNVSLNSFDASSILMSDGSLRKLPGLISSAKSIFNASLLFEHGDLSGRLAYNHTGRMPYSFNTSNAWLDQYYQASDVLDLQLRYRLTKQASLVFQAQNLTGNRPVRMTGPVYSETLENGRSFFAGFNAKFD